MRRWPHRADRPQLRGALMFKRLKLSHVLALDRLLLRDMRVFGALQRLHMLALQRLQLLVSALFECLDLLLVLTFEFLLAVAFRHPLLFLCMLAFQGLQLLTMLLVDRLELLHVPLKVVLLLARVLALKELLLGGIPPLDHLKMLGVLTLD